ncbi:MAG: DUF499 domain-containing protein [Pirellulaceae bacterium]|nr:DUF499 domain-containing protein [Pirellulaceae bacterium]
MIELKLRDEFKGKRLKGTTVDFTNQSQTGALQQNAADFLRITYPSHDLLKTIESTGPGQSRPLAMIGSRGQGKSHLMAALYHLCKDPQGGREWLDQWAHTLGDDKLKQLQLRNDCHVIAESMHLQRYQYLWDVIFDNHPKGEAYRTVWEHDGENKTAVPGYDILFKMFQDKPTMLIFDEFQTWFEGLTNTKQHPRRNWAFNFIQILSEIAQSNPELLVLAVSVRDGNSDAYQQIRRVNPVDVDFKGPYAKRDRKRLLLYRIFENRIQAHESEIELLIGNHMSEYFRLENTPEQDREKKKAEFIESWPYAPHLLQLLDDQVLVATDAQQTRDLIRILVDLFKHHDPKDAIVTAADFSLTNEKSAVGSLLDSVANQEHKDLREKAQRNLAAVKENILNASQVVPHAEDIISSLWLRSLNVEQMRGAEPHNLQIDITRDKAIDDNAFEVELAQIVDNSFNIHQVGGRLVFKQEENARAKLLSYAKNNRIFREGEHAGKDIDHLSKLIEYVLGGDSQVSAKFRVLMLRNHWDTDPWSDLEERFHPKLWDDKKLTVLVLPEYPEKRDATLGGWLKTHLQENRNTIRFLLPQKGMDNVFYDRELIVLARAVYLAQEWHKNDPKAGYADLAKSFSKDELVPKLKARFDRLALLNVWNYADPAKCVFEEERLNSQGDKIPDEIDKIIREEIFIPEDFEEYVLLLAQSNESVGKLLKDLREPRPGGKPCIPWLGETELKEKLLRICAHGEIAINLRGTEHLQAKPGEDASDAWNRMKGKLGAGSHLFETIIQLPDSAAVSGGKVAVGPADPTAGDAPSGNTLPNLFGGGVAPPVTLPIGQGNGTGGNDVIKEPTVVRKLAHPTSALNLTGQLESWQVKPATPVTNIRLCIDKMTGAQLDKFLKSLPDGFTYGLELDKEAD